MAINRDKVHAAAAKLLQQGKYDKAIAELKRLVEDDATDDRTLLKLGETYVKIGARKDAIDVYEKAANIYAGQGFYLKAVAVYKQVLRVDATIPDVHLKLAELYQQLGLTSDCVQHYQQVSVLYEQAGKLKESLHILRRLTDLEPDNLPLRLKLAEAFQGQGMLADAVQEVRSSLTFLKSQNRHDDYLRVAERLIAWDPSALDVTREVAQIYMARGETKMALGKLQACFKDDPRNLEILALIAEAFLSMDQVAKSVSVFKEMARIHEANGTAHEAQGLWERVLQHQPGDPDAEAALGLQNATVVASSPAATAPSGKPAAPAPTQWAAPVNPQEDQLARLLTETDVYVKYGLKEKAIEHLQKLFAIKVDHIPALEKLKTLNEAIKNRGEAARALALLVEAAVAQGHPRAAEWQAELQKSGGAPAPAPAPAKAAAPAPSMAALDAFDDDVVIEDSYTFNPRSSLSEEMVLEEEPLPTGSFDEPLLSSDDSFGDLDLPPDEALDSSPPRPTEIPRMPTGIGIERPPSKAPPAPAPVPLDFAERSGAVRNDFAASIGRPPPATAPISDSLLEAEDALSYADADPLSAEAEAEAADLFADIGDAGDNFDAFELDAAPAARDDLDNDAIDRLAAEAVAEAASSAHEEMVNVAQLQPGAPGANEGFASTAIMGLSSQEMAEIRDFVASNQGPVAVDDEFGDATVALHTGTRNSDNDSAVPTASGVGRARPTREAGSVSGTAATRGIGLRSSSDGFAEDELATSVTVARPAIAPAAVAAPVAARPAVVDPPEELMSEDEFDATGFELPTDVREILRRPQAPALDDIAAGNAPKNPFVSGEGARIVDDMSDDVSGDASVDAAAAEAVEATAPRMGKLGFADKAQGFESDPANQFFPDELEESEFFIQQDLLDEAKEILAAILEDVPDSARVQWMLARIDAKENGVEEPPAPWERRILEEVEEQLKDLEFEPTDMRPIEPTGQVSVEEVLSQFKKGIAETVPEDDAATHYDLGNAYRDMGLHEDAIGEFKLATRAPGKAADAWFLIGQVRLEQGNPAEALKALGEALGLPQATRDQRAASEYTRASCYEQLGQGVEALMALKRAKANGSPHADVDRRIAALVAVHGDVEAKNGHDADKGASRSTPPKAKNIDYI